MKKFNTKAAGAGIATLAVAGAGLIAMASPASAAPSAPPFEPDPQSLPGAVVFYDAQGNVVTSGTNLDQPFAYAVATSPLDSGATNSVLTYAKPTNGSVSSLWPVSQQTETFTQATQPAGTPADIVALAQTNPVVDVGTAASLNIFNNNTPTDPTPGYANTVEVRVNDAGARGAGNATTGTWWESDIAWNSTSSPITVDGVTVPANGWAQVFPVVTPTTTSLTTDAPAGGVAPGTAIHLTATTSDTSAAGTFNFFDGTTLIGSAAASGGTATFAYTPSANESANFTASFVPTLGDVANPNTVNATMVGGSTSPAQAVTVGTPPTATSVTLSADNTSIASGGTVNLTATVTDATNDAAGLAGSVQFLDGSTSLGTAATNASGVATLATSSLAVGANSLTAIFTPSATGFAKSSPSSPVVVTEAAPAIFAQNPNSSGNVNVTVSAGTLTVTSGFTTSNPLVLTPPTLSTDGTYLSSSTPFKDAAGDQLTVTDSLAGNPGWTLSASSTALTDGSGDTIAASGLGLTGLKLDASGQGTITTTNAPAHNPSPVDTDSNTGLAATAANPNGPVIATAAAGNGEGTTVIEGTVGLDIPTSTPAGTYKGSLVFTAV